MHYGGPHVLPLQQQGLVWNTEYQDTNSQPDFAVSSQKRDCCRARGGKQEEQLPG